tara:strand:+ start:4636 stop:4824 length:189 start_codon:yes stop_codon:yes gene_type:complete
MLPRLSIHNLSKSIEIDQLNARIKNAEEDKEKFTKFLVEVEPLLAELKDHLHNLKAALEYDD